MTIQNNKEFSKRLNQLYREEQEKNPRLTQAKFAKKLGISLSCLKNYLHNTPDPSGTNIRAIATACDVSADWLLGLKTTRSQDKKIGMLLLTISKIEGKTVEPIRMVMGRYSAVSESFEKAQEKMVKKAEDLGADAVIDVHIASSYSEVAVYGTAVKLHDAIPDI